MSSIAFEHGFFWQTLWNLPENANLKTKRKDPNVLMTADSVHIPDLTIKEAPGATDMRHKFQLKGVPEKLNIQLLDYNHQPRPNVAYKLLVEGNWRSGQTDGNGRLTESIPPSAKTGKLIFPAPPSLDPAGKPVQGSKPRNQVMTLQLGDLNPVAEVSGLKARLSNLGYYKGSIDEQLDAAAGSAITAFQKKKGLPVTGIADDATRQKLQEIHGH
jgi:hypothetical protein